MEEQLIKIQQKAKMFKSILLVLLAALISSIVLAFAFNNDDFIGVYVLLLVAFFVLGFIYMFKYYNFNRCMKWLAQKNSLGVCNDIKLDNPTLPKSKVFCGSKAMFFQKSSAIIPYSEIAWIYQYKASAYGIPVAKSIFIFTRDNKNFSVKANIDEFQWLLSNYIMKMYPDIMIGYTAENQKRYKALYRKKR